MQFPILDLWIFRVTSAFLVCFFLLFLILEKTEEHDEKSADSALNLQKERVEMTRAMQEISEVASRGNIQIVSMLISIKQESQQLQADLLFFFGFSMVP